MLVLRLWCELLKTPDFAFRGMKKECKPRKCLIYTLTCGERGSRTYAFKKYHKIANH